MRRWAICHSGTRWTNPERPRLCLFTCYNTVSAKWGKGCPSAEVIAAMPAKRQTLFRGVWHGMSDVPGINRKRTALFDRKHAGHHPGGPRHIPIQ